MLLVQAHPVLLTMIKAGQVAGLKMRAAFKTALAGDSSVIGFKTKTNSSDLVTKVDLACQNAIVAVLLKNHPDHAIIGEESEESSNVLSDRDTFVIDPIDGTSNFAKLTPHCAVLISRITKRVVDYAVVLDPFRAELFYAVKGHGAFVQALDVESLEIAGKNEPRKLSVNGHIRKINEATVLTDFGYTRDALGVAEFIEIERSLLVENTVQALRIMGSCGLGLAWIACGRADVYVERGPYIWDFAPGSLLIREAGGIILDPSGSELTLAGRSLLATSSKELSTELIRIVREAKEKAIKSLKPAKM